MVVVSSQPQVVQTHYVRHYGSGDHGLVLAISATFCVFFFGWWFGLACTIPAIFIALNVSTVLIIYMQDLGNANSQCYRVYMNQNDKIKEVLPQIVNTTVVNRLFM